MIVWHGRRRSQHVIRLQEECGFSHSPGRPRVFLAPYARYVLEVGIRWMPVLHIDDQLWIVEHAGISPLEPVVPPADSLITPLDLGSGNGIVGEGVIPGSDDRANRSFDVLQHLGDAIAISIKQAADQKAWNPDIVLWTHGRAPERTIVLVLEIEQRPRRGFESWPE